MDTYIYTNQNCIVCGDCIDTCELDGQNYLTLSVGGCDFEGNPLPPMITGSSDYVPCHHCDGFWENQTPCQLTCKHDAIKIERF